MLYLATIQHTARQCPGVNSETFKEFLGRFSDEKLEKSRIKVLGTYIDQSCVNAVLGRDHVTTFALEADSPAKVKAFLGPMGGDVRQVFSWDASKVGRK